MPVGERLGVLGLYVIGSGIVIGVGKTVNWFLSHHGVWGLAAALIVAGIIMLIVGLEIDTNM